MLKNKGLSDQITDHMSPHREFLSVKSSSEVQNTSSGYISRCPVFLDIFHLSFFIGFLVLTPLSVAGCGTCSFLRSCQSLLKLPPELPFLSVRLLLRRAPLPPPEPPPPESRRSSWPVDRQRVGETDFQRAVEQD